MPGKKGNINRRQFLGFGALATTGMTVNGCNQDTALSVIETPAPTMPLAADPIPKPQVGFIGVGQRGRIHLNIYLGNDDVEVVAICDISSDNIVAAEALFSTHDKLKPKIFNSGVNDYERMCDEMDLDLVIICTPWELHAPMAVYVMNSDKHVAIEVPAATTVDECWQLVESAEKNKKHCVMLENVNYYEAELLALNLVREGVLGEIVHCEGAYLHDLREINLTEGRHTPSLWRVAHHFLRNGNLYPTHGLGPLANCLNINRGDRFDTIVSMSSSSRSLTEYAKNKLDLDHAMHGAEFKCGDYNSSLIKTEKGNTIYLSFSTGTPRPYSRINMLQGSKGIFEGFPEQAYFDDFSSYGGIAHKWESMDTFLEGYRHPLRQYWQDNLVDQPSGKTHGGADILMHYRLIDALIEGKPTDMDVYDAAALSVVSGLSELSVKEGSIPVNFPDFTRGAGNQWPLHDYSL